MARRDIRVTRA